MIYSSKDPSVLDSGEFSVLELSDYLHTLLRERDMTVIQAVQLCNLERSYGYQLFNGTRRPTRDMLLILSFHLQLGAKQTQRLLKLAGRPSLYARNRRDAALLYAMSHRLTLDETEELLSELEEDSLGYEI